MVNQLVFISGTPGVGKTTIATCLFDKLKSNYEVKLIKINELAISNNLITGTDIEKGYKIVDIDKLNNCIEKIVLKFFNDKNNQNKLIIVEGHLSHFLSNPDKVIILRLDPNILEERLLARNYSDNKIRENLEAESLAICSNEAFDIHENKVNEVNASNLTTNELMNIIVDIIENKKEYPPGNIDFMDWLLNNN